MRTHETGIDKGRGKPDFMEKQGKKARKKFFKFKNLYDLHQN